MATNYQDGDHYLDKYGDTWRVDYDGSVFTHVKRADEVEADA